MKLICNVTWWCHTTRDSAIHTREYVVAEIVCAMEIIQAFPGHPEVHRSNFQFDIAISSRPE
jgi:hypothetical protein